jgi:2-polyprenyl-3-methyl-5-hydroxy-6-metoxy-1,4-benzoquinol methylase
MKLMDEDSNSPINDEETFNLVQSILNGSSGAAASWIGAYRPATDTIAYCKYANWNASHYDIYLKFIEMEMDEPGNVLEIGSASGARSVLLARYGNRVTGIDLQKERHEFAKTHNSHPNVNYVLGMFPSLTLSADYDYIFCVSVLYQSGNEPAEIVKSALSLLKPGGKLFVYDNKGQIESSGHAFRMIQDYGGLISVVMVNT